MKTLTISRDSLEDRRSLLGEGEKYLPVLLTEQQVKNKIENYVGCVPYPVG